MEYLLKGGLVMDPRSGLEEKLDVHIKEGKIVALASGLQVPQATVIDVEGKIVAPGFIDMHVHLREPGGEAHETILTGCQAAVAGGFSTICAMPNTKPCADHEPVVETVLSRAEKIGLARVYPIGAITKGQQGQDMAEIGCLVRAGAIAVSDDGNPVISSQMMRRVLEYSKIFGIPVISHCEDKDLAAGGVMHEGYWSTALGLKGVPAQAEETMVARDLILAEQTGGQLHLAHLSTQGSLELLRFFKNKGLQVTAEATPHHLLLTDEAVKDYHTSTKVNPPLRSAEHGEAVRTAVKEGLIQCLVTDHAPWCQEEKDQEYNAAPNGISGLETAVAVCWDTLVVKEGMKPLELIAKFTTGPADVLHLPLGTLSVGAEADITVIDPNLIKTVDVAKFYSKGKNSPLHERSFQGWPVLTMVKGKLVMENGALKGE